MGYILEEVSLVFTPFIILLVDSIRIMATISNLFLYLIPLFYSMILFNIQLIYSGSRGVRLKPLWLIPLMITIQFYASFLVGYEFSSFMVLVVLILVFTSYVGNSHLDAMGLNLYAVFVLLSVFAIIYLHLPYMSFIILGPLWEYLFVQSVCRESSGECVPMASLSAALLYNYNYLLTIYAVLASCPRILSKDKIKYAIIFDGITRLIILWVGIHAT